MNRGQLALALAITVAVLAGGLALDAARSGVAAGQGASYQVLTESTGPDAQGSTTYAVTVLLADPDANDFAEYKLESDGRVAAWAADPASAPVIDGRPVKVTFRTPQDYAATMGAIGPRAGRVLRWAVVGHSDHQPETLVEGEGDLDPAAIGAVADPLCGVALDPQGQPDPSHCETITYTGAIEVDFEVAGGVDALTALRDDPNVYLVDTTGLEVLADLEASGIPPAAVQVLTLPWPMYDQGGAVSWP